MKRDQIVEAIGKIDDEIILKVSMIRNGRKRKLLFRRWISMAACFAVIMSLALTAEATNGTVSNLLAPLFGGAQTEIVDEIGGPIGASTSVNGYTLTVDAIIGDRYSVMVGYTLSRDDGQPIPENVGFLERAILGSGYGTKIEIDEEDPSIAHFHERWRRSDPLLGRIVTISFSTLIIDNGEEEDIIVAEGTWEITFTLRYPDTSEKLPVKNLYVYDETGRKYQIKKVILSPMGLHVDLLEFNPVFGKASYAGFQTAVVLKDGTKVSLDGGGGGRMTEGDKTRKVSYYGEFDIPIPHEDIEAIIFCDTVYKLE